MANGQSLNSSGRKDIFQKDEISFLDLYLVLVRHKKMLLVFWLSAFALSLGATLLMPDVYTATARALPLKRSDRYFYANLLKSPIVADVIIEKFDLKEVYREDSKGAVYDELKKRTSISAGKKDHIIYVKVNDIDPKRVAGMANAYLDELKKHSAKKASGSHAFLLQFLGERLEVVKEDLRQAEQALKLFQQKHKSLRVDDQTRGVIQILAKLKGELASKELELGVVPASKKAQVPQETVLGEWFVRLNSQVRRLEHSMVEENIPDDYSIEAAVAPEVRLEFARLLLDYRVQTALFELLTLQIEVAKINEVKNLSSIQVLNTALVPGEKSGPKRSLIVLLTTFTVGFLAVLVAFVRDYLQHIGGGSRKVERHT